MSQDATNRHGSKKEKDGRCKNKNIFWLLEYIYFIRFIIFTLGIILLYIITRW